MKLADLITLLSVEDDARTPLLANQYRFAYDREGGRLLDGWRKHLKSHGVLRVQTQRRWDWHGVLMLPDRSSSQLRTLPFLANVQGNIAADEASARGAVEALLSAWARGSGQFDEQGRIQTLLEDAVFAWASTNGNKFVESFIDPGVQKFQEVLRGALVEAGLGVDHVALQPRSLDRSLVGRHEQTIDLVDAGRPLTVRDPERLDERTIGYHARLEWSGTVEGHVGRFGYEGTVEGDKPGDKLASPAVNGQIQPLTEWFRRLLRDALEHETWDDDLNPEPSQALIDTVSSQLERGVGRKILTLRLFPVGQANATKGARGSLNFKEKYRIFGVQSDTPLTIEHEVRYDVSDRIRSKNAGITDVEKHLRDLITEEMQRFLHGKRFDQIVSLYVASLTSDSNLQKEVEDQVRARAHHVGITIQGPLVTILELSESEFVKGKRIVLPDAEYDMRADFNHKPSFSVYTDVMLRDDPASPLLFAKSSGSGEGFEKRVQSVLTDAIQDVLGSQISAAAFYSSMYQLRGKDDEDHKSEYPDARTMILEEVDKRLGEHFGLKVRRFEMVRSARDKVAERVHQILDRNHIEVEFVQEQGVEPLLTRVIFTVDLRVLGFVERGWSGFHARIGRSLDDHVQEVRNCVRIVLKRWADGLPRPERVEALRRAMESGELGFEILRQVMEDCGLSAQLQHLNVNVQRPVTDQALPAELVYLDQELKYLGEKLVQLAKSDVGDFNLESRDSIRQKMRAVRAEIEELRTTAATYTEAQAGSVFTLPQPVAILPSGLPDSRTQKLLGKPSSSSSESRE